MSDQFCDQESAVIRVIRSGKWEPSLRAHRDSCAVCREAAKIAITMSSLVLAEASQIPPAPDPQRVWLKAAFAERQRRSAKITQLAGFVYAVLAAAIGFGTYTTFKSPFKGVEHLIPSSAFTTASIAPVVVVVACVLLALFLSSPPTKRSR